MRVSNLGYDPLEGGGEKAREIYHLHLNFLNIIDSIDKNIERALIIFVYLTVKLGAWQK